MKYVYLVLFTFIFAVSNAQDRTFLAQDITINKHIDGTLLLPDNVSNPPLAIIIGGSGPTDRNGNQNFMQSNALKKLAEGLSKKDIATFRYDKRIVKQIRQRNVQQDIQFEDFVTDAISVLLYFKDKYSFNGIYIIGHSQGSLVGIMAASQGADGLVSLAGAGKTIDEVITEQVAKTAPMFTDDTKRVFAMLKQEKTTTDYPPALESVFNLEVQPFLSSWMRYNPQQEISKLDMPILIINGSKDLQVPVTEAQLLHEAARGAILKLIDKMNHVLVTIEGDDLENSKSYNESKRPLSSTLIDSIASFIKQE